MIHKALAPLALVVAVGLLPACNGDDTATTDTATGTDTDTTTDGTTTSSMSTTSAGTTSVSGTTTTGMSTESDSGTTATTSTSSTGSTTSVCDEGTENCACIDGTTCNDGLMCENNVCVPTVPLTFCERIGGTSGITELHTNFVGKVLVDERINAYFLNSDVDGANLIACLDKQIGEAIGCDGVVYDCQDMLTAHAGMGISTQDFTDLAEDYNNALTEHQGNYPTLTADDVMTIMTTLAGMAGDIVESPNNDETVYHRVGRKEGVKTLVGKPGDAGSFVDNVANDVMINGFFGAANFDRLNTCLTRQVGGIDGPAKYGMEVDSPAPGVDDGVALADPCKDMKTSHTGLTDMNDNSPITYDDFVALVTDLITAMTSAGVAMDDQSAILAVLGPMCEDIVADSPNDCPGNSESVTQDVAPMNAAIVDDAYKGTIDTMNCAMVDLPDNGLNVIAGVKVDNVKITHTWIGDLTVKLVSPDNTVITLQSRAGVAEAADDGGAGIGDSSNLDAAFPVSYADANMKSAKTMGDESNQTGYVVCKDAPKNCLYKPNPGAAIPGDLASLKNKQANGTWKVCVGDGGPGDTGQFQGATLVIDRVKFPIP